MDDRCDRQNDAQLHETGYERPEVQDAPANVPGEDTNPLGESVGSEEVGTGPLVAEPVEEARDDCGDTLGNLDERPTESERESESDEGEVTQETIDRVAHRSGLLRRLAEPSWSGAESTPYSGVT